ncbi:MAG: hypothetical protein ACRDSL_11250 [Pseudonocardiaceae bacterium]
MATRRRSRFRGTLSGISRHLTTVGTAVLLAPVLPDLAVDASGAEGGAAVLARVSALGVLVIICYGIYLAESWRYRKHLNTVVPQSIEAQQRDTLVLPLSKGTQVRPQGTRDGNPTPGEILLRRVQPRQVVLVTAPGSDAEEWLRITRTALDQDGLDTTTFTMRSPDSVEWLVEDLSQHIDQVRANGRPWDGTSTVFDLTGGTVAMSLAMLRTAAAVGAECLYITADYGPHGPIPGTQRVRQIDPRSFLSAVVE